MATRLKEPVFLTRTLRMFHEIKRNTGYKCSYLEGETTKTILCQFLLTPYLALSSITMVLYW